MPAGDFAAMSELLQSVKDSDKPILVITHEWPDGDAVGSSVGLCSLLNANGWKAEVYLPAMIPDAYRSFVPEKLAVFSNEDINTKYSMVVNTDASTVDRLELGTAEFKSITIPFLTFDHHPDDEMFGTMSCVNPKASSACELVCRFAVNQGWTIPSDAATALFLGTATDTGCFRFANTTAGTHEAAMKLLECGADQERVINEVYFSKPVSMLRFETELMSNIQFDFDGALAWVWASRELLDKYGINLKDIEQVIEMVRGLKGVVVAAVVKPTSNPGIFRVSLRSKDPTVSVGRIARQLRGGGHEAAAGCSIFAATPNDCFDALRRYVRRELRHEP